MEVKIGIQNVAREIVFESELSATKLLAAVDAAVVAGGLLRLAGEKGRTVVVPISALGYVELGEENERRVGFGSN